MKKLTNLELMLVVMRADEQLQGMCTRGTTNWAASIGKAVQNAIAKRQVGIPPAIRQELMQSRFKTEDGKPIDQQWFTRKDVQVLLDKLEKYLDNTPIATHKELT